ncbi:transposase, partial [Escherichia coli]|uniref:transposase n=1 Tax=Escherichia coli TaxID=562 RepID=UPI003EE3936B
SGFHEAELPLDDAKRVLHPGTDAGFHVFDVDGRFVLARILLHGEEQFVSADAGYQGAPQREELAEVDVDWLIAERPGKVKT